jgi:hypothetical protein
VASSNSPGRVTGLAFNFSPVTLVWLGVCASPLGPEPTFGADFDLGAETWTGGNI